MYNPVFMTERQSLKNLSKVVAKMIIKEINIIKLS